MSQRGAICLNVAICIALFVVGLKILSAQTPSTEPKETTGGTIIPAPNPTTQPATSPTTQAGGRDTPTLAPADFGKPVTAKAAPGKMITIPNDVQEIQAYWITPAGRGPWPGIVMIHDIYGLTDWTKTEAEGLAQQGYAVIVPDLYTRQNLKDNYCPDARQAWNAYEKMSDQQALSDLRAAVTYLAANENVGSQPIGTVGYDMGGIYAMMLASLDLRIKVAVNYYGRVIYSETSNIRPVSPVEMALNLRAPLLSFYGQVDPQNPSDHLKRLETRLANNPSKTYFSIIRYPDVGHGFLVETRQGYNADAAKDAHTRTRDFLAKILRAAPEKPVD